MKNDRWSIAPKPYVLVSSIAESLWAFYGVGQIWLTHKNVGYIQDWSVRVPRIASKNLMALVERLKPEIETFIGFCNQQELTATLVIERQVIELHWMPRRAERSPADHLGKLANELDQHFMLLADKFCEVQLTEPAEY